MELQPVTLEGKWVRLEPLSLAHADQLAVLAADPEVTRYLPGPAGSRPGVCAWIEAALRNQAMENELPFTIIDRASGSAIGSTRIMDIRREHRGVEIGYSWLGRAWWRTVANSEAKYLLLLHLFESVGCIRVALKTDLLNERSQRAIERLGAVREGVLRQHMIVRDGRRRDTVYYSIIESEWSSIRARMESSLYGTV